MAKRRRLKNGVLLILVAFATVAVLTWFLAGLRAAAPRREGRKLTFRYETSIRLPAVLNDLQRLGILRNALAARFLALLQRRPSLVPAGSYIVSSGMSADEILNRLRNPIVLLVRLPETDWASRTARLLAANQIADADDYMRLVKNPQFFQSSVSFPLPKDSLEGYLYPRTYPLPPLFGAQRVIQMQLKEFGQQVWNTPDRPKDMKRILTIASLVQLEAGTDDDRPIIAGVIENRLKKKMPLQIDASILYALQKWRRLKFKDYYGVDSPYNTYLNKGLPPGPICSPDEKDIQAAMHPAKHGYLYYVALPDGRTIYAATYKEHLKNIAKRRAALKELHR